MDAANLSTLCRYHGNPLNKRGDGEKEHYSNMMADVQLRFITWFSGFYSQLSLRQGNTFLKGLLVYASMHARTHTHTHTQFIVLE